jgi:hypothetical protein
LKLGLFCGERSALGVFLEHSEHIGKFIGPAGPALIAGASQYVNPWATREPIDPAFIYFAAWYLLAICIPSYGMGTRGRKIEELHAALMRPTPVKIPAHWRRHHLPGAN